MPAGLAHNILPVRKNVARRGINLYTICPVSKCKKLGEDCGHLFFKCKYAKQSRRLMNLENIRTELVRASPVTEPSSDMASGEVDATIGEYES